MIFVLSSMPVVGHALDNGLARTPPMGWNSWNKYGCKGLNEKVVRETADAMASNGMKDAGYQFVIIDDCWQTGRDADGNIVADAERFPSGIKSLADYIHAKGLKFGIYTDVGTMTCAKRPGSIGHEYQDAKQYANWGVDYLKEDWCNTLPGQNSESSYTLMRDALAAAGRPIVFSICEWGSTKPWLWAGSIGNLWRATGDIQDCWDCKKDWGGNGVVQILDQMNGLETYAGPGHWNDPDMLEVGNGDLTPDENYTHMTQWCMLASPLLIGCDMTKISPFIVSLFSNDEVLAVNQDPLGKQGTLLKRDAAAKTEVWIKPLEDESIAVALYNRSDAPADVSVAAAELPIYGPSSAFVRDLWRQKDIGVIGARLTAHVAAHGAELYRIEPVKAATTVGTKP
jgi:alpha-galactosidase